MRSSLRLSFIVAAHLATVSACAVEEGEPIDARGHVLEQGQIDCTERSDTGYSNGDAFAITVVTVDGEPVEVDAANAYYVMQQAAAADGVALRIVSGFRTMSEQEYLYGCYVNCNCNSCNLAASPGYSNHQSGHAFDLNTADGGVLNWLNAHGGDFGFARTVPSEVWHWEWWGGGPGGGPCRGDQLPRGYLDSAGCDGISGWAQDADAPDSPIDVHIYIGGPAGSPDAFGYATHANVHRDDLCAAIGSCEHGFAAPAPLAFFDGVDHPVYAYGIGADGGGNALLASTPGTLRCDPAALTPRIAGTVRRTVPSMDVFNAWGLSATEIAPLSDDVIDGVPLADPLSASPLLVRVNNAPEVYVREGDVLRHVINPASMAAWAFDFASVVVIDNIDGTVVGAPWPAAPFLAQGSADTVWMLDAPPPLWAALIRDDVPARVHTGAAVDVALTFANLGSNVWQDVALAPTPRDEASALCDESWVSCTRMANVDEVAPGGETTVHVTLRAPLDPGPVTVCFGLVSGAHWFSDPGENGPLDDAICRRIDVVAAGGEAAGQGGVGHRGGGDAGASCASGGGSPASATLLFGIALLWRRRRR